MHKNNDGVQMKVDVIGNTVDDVAIGVAIVAMTLFIVGVDVVGIIDDGGAIAMKMSCQCTDDND